MLNVLEASWLACLRALFHCTYKPSMTGRKLYDHGIRRPLWLLLQRERSSFRWTEEQCWCWTTWRQEKCHLWLLLEKLWIVFILFGFPSFYMRVWFSCLLSFSTFCHSLLLSDCSKHPWVFPPPGITQPAYIGCVCHSCLSQWLPLFLVHSLILLV